ncbi:hypothetical protein GCM10017771_57830 [Streptomyces capitiformicae]|uniref:Uncharacterized protein n=1 Tax=Streptomyces capitiformicae TaxID=2014920 RepID=A0A918Z7J8_9ACTN|nr:hypothetical protein GCM10017771_57830 [Streptomyces capitiformicae]
MSPGRFRRVRRLSAASAVSPAVWLVDVLVNWLVIGSSSASAMVSGIGLDSPRKEPADGTDAPPRLPHAPEPDGL